MNGFQYLLAVGLLFGVQILVCTPLHIDNQAQKPITAAFYPRHGSAYTQQIGVGVSSVELNANLYLQIDTAKQGVLVNKSANGQVISSDVGGPANIIITNK